MNQSKLLDFIRDNHPEITEIKSLSQGGQKFVFEGYHQRFGHIVFKVIKPNAVDFERTSREIRAVALINSDNIPKIFTSNFNVQNPDFYWIIEEFISGYTLRYYLLKQHKFTTKEILCFLDTMLNLSIELEKNNLVHRDIKPENIIYNIDIFKFWLIDFGLARHLDLVSITNTNEPFGLCTWGYAASEQFRNLKAQINIRADLFSIGVVAFEMITGYNPFIKNARDVLQIIHNIESVPLPDFRINGDSQYLLSIFIKNLASNHLSRRPRTAKEALAILNSIRVTVAF